MCSRANGETMDIAQPTVEELKALLIDQFDQQHFETHARWIAGVAATFPALEQMMNGATYCLKWQTAPESAGQKPKEHFVNSNRSRFHLATMRQFLLNPPEDSVGFLIHKEKVPHWNREFWMFDWEPSQDDATQAPGNIAHLVTYEPYEIKRKLIRDWCGGDQKQAAEFLQNMITGLDAMELEGDDQHLSYLLQWAF